MQHTFDFLAEKVKELKAERALRHKEACRAARVRKSGKHGRIAKLLKNLVKAEPSPLVS